MNDSVNKSAERGDNSGIVQVKLNDNVAWVTINNPPVNATSVHVRSGLVSAVRQVEAMGAQVAVLRCTGRTFIAGGDMSEFDQTPVEPHLPDVVRAIEDSTVPWVAAIHGTALGGGLEVALGCAWRVAIDSARFGLPEVNVGLIPGAGGTQRLPRLVGLAFAIEMATSGKPISAQAMREAGGIDQILPDLDASVLTFVQDLPDRPVPLSHRPVEMISQEWLASKRVDLQKKSRGQRSPVHNLDMVAQSGQLSFDDGEAAERKLHLELRQSPESRALRHAFFAERSAARPVLVANASPASISTVAIVGGGLMGAGIAVSCLNAGLQVGMIERNESSAEQGLQRVTDIIGSSVARGRLTQATADEQLQNFGVSATYTSAVTADIVIEAVFEDLDTKRAVFAQLADVVPSNTILATNTSYLDPTSIFDGISDSSRCLGLHFFSPAHVMKLLEIVNLPETSADVLATGFALAKTLRKNGVVSGICDGFIGNRMLAAYRREADYLLADGALPFEIDRAMTDFGMPMGPYALQDLTGLQISWANRKRQAATRNPQERYIELGDRLCEAECFGQRSSSGWYRYAEGSRKPIRSEATEAMILNYSNELGITRHSFSATEIERRLLTVLINEGALIIEEGITERSSDVDVVQMLGYGFPRWRGGPMHYAEEVGLDGLRQSMRAVIEQSPGSWQLSKLMS